MIRPCDLCGGSGERLATGSDSPLHGMIVVRCGRCVDMPKLPVLKYCPPDWIPNHHFTALERGWFMPDPDSIMWWCFNHKASAGGGFTTCMYEGEWGMARPEACDIEWVESPTRLEVIE